LSFNGSLQRVRRAAFRSRTTPGVNGDIGRFGRIALTAAYWVRRQEEFHAFDVTRWRAYSVIHVSASDPFRTGRHPDLIRAPVAAQRCAHGVTSMIGVVTRLKRIVSAVGPAAGMNAVVPVVIVICDNAIPPAIMIFQRVMRPTISGIGATDHDSLAGVA